MSVNNVENKSKMDIASAVVSLEDQYTRANQNSYSQFLDASRVLPGGNTRVALYYDPFPLYIQRAEGGHVYDVDEHRYRDFMNDLTAGFYGHSDSRIIEALKSALDNGISYGGPHPHEARLASQICKRFASIERVRFTNSGTEANLLAMRLARAVKKRSLVLAFYGSYHGSLASYLDVNAPLNVDQAEMVFARYNDIDDVRRCIEAAEGHIAAIIVEPMIGSGGGIVGDWDFLRSLRSISTEYDALLIFDEVQTARFHPGGLQTVVGITPDITTIGKSIGGGINFGAFGGKAEILNWMNPMQKGAIGHGGTFNNNVLTMIAGSVGLEEIATEMALRNINELGDTMRRQLIDAATRFGMALSVGGFGSILSLHFQEKLPARPEEVKTSAVQRKLFHLHMLLKGFYVPRRGTINLSLQTTQEDCSSFVEAFAEFAELYGRQCHN
ncbi:aspartate aminotransferase family protein [Paraburkholderia phymatum]|uniref:Aspartate aminotransferase family protein n=1 Tax=Paraburkholderia phymatum TaxID=148447 RepID=A0ACC6UBV7_9BURK